MWRQHVIAQQRQIRKEVSIKKWQVTYGNFHLICEITRALGQSSMMLHGSVGFSEFAGLVKTLLTILRVSYPDICHQ